MNLFTTLAFLLFRLDEETVVVDRLTELWDFLGVTLFTVKNNEITLASVVVFTLLVLFFVILSKVASLILYRKVLKNVKMDEGIRFTLQRITTYTILILGLIFSVQFIGLDLGAFAVIFGLLSVGIGFGLQNLTSNFISGIILLFERPISIGDRVMVNDIEGDVKEINIRSTTINSLDNISIIVPNTDFVSGRVINYTLGDQRIRINIDVGVSYNSDLDLVLRIIKDVASKNSEVLETPEPDVLLNNFGDSSWDMILRCWISNPYTHARVKSDLRCEIVRQFRKNNIEIPFPQRDLHLKTPESIQVKSTE